MTTYTEEEIVSFGNYLLSEARKELFKSHPSYPNEELLDERLAVVHDSDVENWKGINKEIKL